MLPSNGLFGGFDPSAQKERWFERHRGFALLLALVCHFALAGVVVYLELNRDSEITEDVLLDEPEIENLDDEFVEEEEEIEPEPEPPPPEPKKRQEIRNVQEQTKDVQETDAAPEREKIDYEPEPQDVKPKEAVENPVQKAPERRVAKKAKKKTEDIGDRTAARPMPAEGTPPRPKKSNSPPGYPESLRKKNISGTVKVKLKIYMDGSVRGMKVLRKNVRGTDDPEEIKRAQSLFLKSVVAAVKSWKFDPAKLKGKTITVWWPVTFPFKLS